MYPVSLTQSYFPAVATGAIEPLTIGDMLRRRAQEHAQTVALKEIGYDGAIGRVWTYAELRDDAERLGRALASRHAPGARIAVYANNSPEWVLLEFAAAMAGLTLVTVNPAFQTRELKYVVEQSRSEAIYYVAEFRGSAMKATVAEVGSAVSAVEHCILLTDHGALFDGEESGVLPPVDPADVTQIQYTSGTTGFPKGALLHHHGLIQNGARHDDPPWPRPGRRVHACRAAVPHHRMRDLPARHHRRGRHNPAGADVQSGDDRPGD
jgi:fatty-acyl-CoA synthase